MLGISKLCVWLLLALAVAGCNPLGGNNSKFASDYQPGLPANGHLPEASDGTLQVQRNQIATGTLAAKDPDARPLTFLLVNSPSRGSVIITDAQAGTFTYTPNTWATGSDTFSFKANNGVADSNTAAIQVTIETSAFSTSWPFDASDASSLYSYPDSTIEFFGGVTRLKAADQTDTSALGFGASDGGTFSGTHWDSASGVLRLGATASCDAALTNCIDAAAAIPTAGLVAHWAMDQASWSHAAGDVVDDTPNANHGQSAGGAATTPTGKVHRGGVFASSGDFVVVPDSSSLEPTTSVSVSSWIKNTGEAWAYRRRVALSPATPAADFQVRVTLTTGTFDYTKVQSAGQDLRFADAAGAALNYWIENWDSSGTSTIWVKVPTSGTSGIYMYYGNPVAAAGSDGTATFVFFDDFAATSLDLSKWTVFDSGVVTVHTASGELQITGTTTAPVANNTFGVATIASFGTDTLFESKFRVVSQSSNAWGAWKADFGMGYMSVNSEGPHDHRLAYWAPGWTDQGDSTLDLQTFGFQKVGEVLLSDGSYLHFENDTQTGSRTGLSTAAHAIQFDYGPDLPSETFDARFDDVRVRKYAASEPVATLASEQPVGVAKEGSYALGTSTQGTFASINGTWATGAAVATGVWNHVVLTYDKTLASNQIKLYLNGDLIGSATSTAAIAVNANPLRINDAFGLAATYDETTVWNRALSAGEILALYQAQAAPFGGSFVSRTFDGLSDGRSWTSLAWTSPLPFYKSLPDGGTSETQYAAQSPNLMNHLVGLWHFDESSWNGTPNEVKDASTSLIHGTATGAIDTTANGKLGRAGAFNVAGAYVNLGVNSALNIGTSKDMSVSAWFKHSTTVSTSWLSAIFGNLSNEGANPRKGFELVMNGALNANPGRIGVAVGDGSNWGVGVESTQAYNDDQWHHVVMVIDRVHGIGLYIDGKQVAHDPTNTSGWDNGHSSPATIGNVQDGWNSVYQWRGNIDEVAVWDRALSDGTAGTPNEILELYRRGSNRIKYQVQSCFDAACQYKDSAHTATTWTGPDGTDQTYFSELGNTSGATTLASPPRLSLPSLGVSRYFRYRAVFESDDVCDPLVSGSCACSYNGAEAACSPELKSVEIGPDHYSSSSPSVTSKVGVDFDSLSSFSQTLGSSCPGGVGYNLSRDGSNWYYWAGSAWAPANGTFAQTTAATAVHANVSGFDNPSGQGSFFFKAFLNSNGDQPCELDQLELGGRH